MILGAKDKRFVDNLKQERLDAIKRADQLVLEIANVNRDFEKERAELIGEIMSLKEMLKACTDSINDFNKSLSHSVVTTNEVVTEPIITTITEDTPKDFFMEIRELINATNWEQVARALNISVTQLNKYRKGVLPLNKEKKDEFTYLATKVAKKGA